jgi:hypothetical protein
MDKQKENKKTFTDRFAPLKAKPEPEVPPAEEVVANARVTVQVSLTMIETMKDWEYWEGMTHTDTVNEALTEYFARREVKPRPDRVKNKPRPGRKAKASLKQ